MLFNKNKTDPNYDFAGFYVIGFPLPPEQIARLEITVDEDTQNTFLDKMNNLPQQIAYIATPLDRVLTAASVKWRYRNTIWNDELKAYVLDEKALKGMHSKALRNKRNQVLVDTDYMVLRHNEQRLIFDENTTLSNVEVQKLLIYRQKLRDISAHPDFPNVELPGLEL